VTLIIQKLLVLLITISYVNCSCCVVCFAADYLLLLLLNLWSVHVGVSLFTFTFSVCPVGVCVCFCSTHRRNYMEARGGSCLLLISWSFQLEQPCAFNEIESFGQGWRQGWPRRTYIVMFDYYNIGGQLDELLTSPASRCRVYLGLLSSLSCRPILVCCTVTNKYDWLIDWLIDRCSGCWWRSSCCFWWPSCHKAPWHCAAVWSNSASTPTTPLSATRWTSSHSSTTASTSRSTAPWAPASGRRSLASSGRRGSRTPTTHCSVAVDDHTTTETGRSLTSVAERQRGRWPRTMPNRSQSWTISWKLIFRVNRNWTHDNVYMYSPHLSEYAALRTTVHRRIHVYSVSFPRHLTCL